MLNYINNKYVSKISVLKQMAEFICERYIFKCNIM